MALMAPARRYHDADHGAPPATPSWRPEGEEEEPWSCDELRDAMELDWRYKGLTAAHMETLGMLLATNGLPQLQERGVSNSIDAKDMEALVGGLGRRALPSLARLYISSNNIGNAGVATLAAALSRGAMPSLQRLVLAKNSISDEGMVALAAPLPAAAVDGSEFLLGLPRCDNRLAELFSGDLVVENPGLLFPTYHVESNPGGGDDAARTGSNKKNASYAGADAQVRGAVRYVPLAFA